MKDLFKKGACVAATAAMAVTMLPAAAMAGTQSEEGNASHDPSLVVPVTMNTSSSTWKDTEGTEHDNGSYVLTVPTKITLADANIGAINVTEDYSINVAGIIPDGAKVEVGVEESKLSYNGNDLDMAVAQGKQIWNTEETLGSINANDQVTGTDSDETLKVTGTVTKMGEYEGTLTYTAHLTPAPQTVSFSSFNIDGVHNYSSLLIPASVIRGNPSDFNWFWSVPDGAIRIADDKLYDSSQTSVDMTVGETYVCYNDATGYFRVGYFTLTEEMAEGAPTLTVTSLSTDKDLEGIDYYADGVEFTTNINGGSINNYDDALYSLDPIFVVDRSVVPDATNAFTDLTAAGKIVYATAQGQGYASFSNITLIGGHIYDVYTASNNGIYLTSFKATGNPVNNSNWFVYFNDSL